MKETFLEIAGWILRQSGMVVPPDSISFDVHPEPAKKYVAGKVGYNGPLGAGGSPAKIKLDLTNNEILVLPPVMNEVYYPYSDKPAGGIHARCYSYVEVFAEKVRALTERLRPRDLYDVVHLFRRQGKTEDRKAVLKTLEEKCRFKAIPVPTYQSIDAHTGKEELKAEWDNMLKHQLPNLPSMENFWKELPDFFNWLVGLEKPALPKYALAADERPYIPPRPARTFDYTAPIEGIRMAAANRVCIQLTYHGKTRTIEPYSFRQSSKGNYLFYGYEMEAGHIKAFKIDEIQAVRLTGVSYYPRYFVEIH